MDGYELTGTARAEPALARMRLVAITGYAQPADRDRALQAGLDDHLPKPASLDRLEALLRNGPMDSR
jgi:CheY-like chemotaxis protein